MSSELDMPAPKRVPPPTVEPATIEGVRFEAIHFGLRRGLDQNGGYIGAYDPQTGEELWTLKVYTTTYDPDMETDAQDVFIEKLEPEGPRLIVVDEYGRRYVVDVKARQVLAK